MVTEKELIVGSPDGRQENLIESQQRQQQTTIMQPCCNFLEYPTKTKRRPEDPMSHRIIEKRRRDRMNNCLADLSRLIPAEYLKKGRGRIEKTEIIEMAIKHMKYLQSRLYSNINIAEKIDLRKNVHQSSSSENIQQQCLGENRQLNQANDLKEAYKHGFQECVSEVMHYLIEVEGYYPGEKMCVRLMNHLENHYDRILKDDQLLIHQNNNRSDVVSSSSTMPQTIGSVESRNPPAEINFQSQRHDDSRIDKSQPVRMGIIIPPSHIATTTTNRNKYNGCEQNDDSFTVQANNDTDHHNRHNDDNNNNIEHHGPSDDSSNSSQLREILTGGPSPQISSSTVFAPQPRPNIIRKLPPLESPPTLNAAIGHEQTVISGSSLYKFKNNIKERFSAEHSIVNSVITTDRIMCPSSSKKRRSSTDDSSTSSGSSVHSDQIFNDTPSPIAPAASSVKLISESPTTTIPHPVPIFALHSKGAFYVPLTVNSDILNPFLSDLNTDLNLNTFSSLVLHPVTISVNFQRPLMKSISSYDTVLSVPGIGSSW